MIRGGIVVLMGLAATGTALAQRGPATVRIFAAGSLRGVVSALARKAAADYGIVVEPTFGGSGSLRERIEKGAPADLFMSADVASPRKLALEHRTVVPAIPFARNRMCIISQRAAGVTAANLVDRMLSGSVRLKTSTPIVDPGGDYAWAIFDRIDTLHPGSGDILKAKARASMSLTATPTKPGESAAAALFAAKKIDMSITYCSGAAALEKQVPGLTSLVVPPQLDPHPLYGLAVLSARPQAQRLALFLLSQAGQAIIEHQGLVPLTQPARSGPRAGATPPRRRS
ncbi:MAG: substrate-binding domain-containing protein [Acetobacteraceae bacterium]